MRRNFDIGKVVDFCRTLLFSVSRQNGGESLLSIFTVSIIIIFQIRQESEFLLGSKVGYFEDHSVPAIPLRAIASHFEDNYSSPIRE